MKALTLIQPWATLVAIGAKRIETRSWRTTYRGPLAIHAAKGFSKWAQGLCHDDPFRTALANVGFLPLGSVLATCSLVGIVPTTQFQQSPVYEWSGPDGRQYHYELTKDEMQFGDYSPGRFAWLLADMRPLDVPVMARGALGLWKWTPTDTPSPPTGPAQ